MDDRFTFSPAATLRPQQQGSSSGGKFALSCHNSESFLRLRQDHIMRSALLLCSLAAVAHALIKPVTIPDTKAHREEQLDKYFEVMPVTDMLDDMSSRILQDVKSHPQEAERFKRAMKLLDTGKIEDTMRNSMLKSLTASEMAFVTEVYTSELGRSVMKKLPVHMADVMPVIDREFKRVMELVTPPEELEKYRKQQLPQVGAAANRM